MTEIEAIEKLKQHFEYLKHAWKPHPDYETMDAIGYAIQALEKQIEMKKYCDENGCAGCPYHNTSLKDNRCMNDFIIDKE